MIIQAELRRKQSEYGIVGNLFEVLPLLTAEVKKLRS